MKKILETGRLILRQFDYGDTKFLIDLLNTEGWLKYIGDRNVKTRKDAIRYLDNGPLRSYEANGFGLSAVVLKSNLQPIGMCGFIRRPELEDTDIGFAFLTGYTGKGYAYEIASATLQYGFEKLNFKRVVAITMPANTSSTNLLNKIGMQNETEIIKDNEKLLLFGINANP